MTIVVCTTPPLHLHIETPTPPTCVILGEERYYPAGRTNQGAQAYQKLKPNPRGKSDETCQR